jgi:hypothetical protein
VRPPEGTAAELDAEQEASSSSSFPHRDAASFPLPPVFSSVSRFLPYSSLQPLLPIQVRPPEGTEAELDAEQRRLASAEAELVASRKLAAAAEEARVALRGQVESVRAQRAACVRERDECAKAAETTRRQAAELDDELQAKRKELAALQEEVIPPAFSPMRTPSPTPLPLHCIRASTLSPFFQLTMQNCRPSGRSWQLCRRRCALAPHAHPLLTLPSPRAPHAVTHLPAPFLPAHCAELQAMRRERAALQEEI